MGLDNIDINARKIYEGSHLIVNPFKERKNTANSD